MVVPINRGIPRKGPISGKPRVASELFRGGGVASRGPGSKLSVLLRVE